MNTLDNLMQARMDELCILEQRAQRRIEQLTELVASTQAQHHQTFQALQDVTTALHQQHAQMAKLNATAEQLRLNAQHARWTMYIAIGVMVVALSMAVGSVLGRYHHTGVSPTSQPAMSKAHSSPRR